MIRRAALALLLAGCEVSFPPCPGEQQGTFVFQLTPQASGTSCSFSPATPDAFAAAISWLPDGGAAFCMQRVLAAPKVGTRSGDEVAFSSEEPTVQVGGCPCQLALVETIAGRVVRDGTGAAVGFDGVVVDTLGLSSDPSCDAASAVCPAPEGASGPSLCCPLVGATPAASCELRYLLQTR